MSIELGMCNYNHFDVYLFYFASRYDVIHFVILYCKIRTYRLYELPSEFIVEKIGQFSLTLYYVTMYTHAGTAVNRFFAICMPLAYRRLNTPKITKISICLVWMAGFLHFIPLNFSNLYDFKFLTLFLL